MARKIRRRPRRQKLSKFKTLVSDRANKMVSRHRKSGKTGVPGVGSTLEENIRYYKSYMAKKAKASVKTNIETTERSLKHADGINSYIKKHGLEDNKVVKAMSPVERRELAVKLKAIDESAALTYRFKKSNQRQYKDVDINSTLPFGEQGQAYVMKMYEGARHKPGYSKSNDFEVGDIVHEVKRNKGFGRGKGSWFNFELRERKSQRQGWSDSLMATIKDDDVIIQIGPMGDAYSIKGSQAKVMYKESYHRQKKNKFDTSIGISFNKNHILTYGGKELAAGNDYNEYLLKTTLPDWWKTPQWWKNMSNG